MIIWSVLIRREVLLELFSTFQVSHFPLSPYHFQLEFNVVDGVEFSHGGEGDSLVVEEGGDFLFPEFVVVLGHDLLYLSVELVDA